MLLKDGSMVNNSLPVSASSLRIPINAASYSKEGVMFTR